MSLDLAGLQAAIAAHGTVVRILVVQTAGSAPRGPGTSMLVWGQESDSAPIGPGAGQSGTIGGGALEFMAVTEARRLGSAPLRRTVPLGPDLGQCCGGAVTLVWERFDAACPPAPIRPLIPGAPRPAGLGPLLPGAPPRELAGWLAEAPLPLPRPIWIYGAGHVGRALVAVLAPLPDIALTWVDTASGRFPELVPGNATRLVAADPALAARYAPPQADHLILTYSHKLDLALCDALLSRPAGSIGLIGSATKWARFRGRLAAMGHSAAQIARIACPIGDPALGKHPQAIALGVATALLKERGSQMHAGNQAG